MRYPRVWDNMERVLKRDRNVTHERAYTTDGSNVNLKYLKKSMPNALAGRCDFTNAAENVRDMLIMNMRDSDCQRELSRSIKTPDEVYRVALSYEHGDRAYKSYPGKPAASAPYLNSK